jgi:hypothetical protein
LAGTLTCTVLPLVADRVLLLLCCSVVAAAVSLQDMGFSLFD